MMKKIFLAAIVALITVFGANAQVKIQSPHPDLDVKVTRCAYASGTVVIDMVITNFGTEEKISFLGSSSNAATTAYDDEGNQYTQNNSKISVGLVSQGLTTYCQDIILPQDVPLKFRMQITKVSDVATKFPIVKLVAESSRGVMGLSRDKPIVIRNLEWVK